MNEPTYHLSSVLRSKADQPEDFDGPLDVILLLLSKNKIEIQDISISSILEQYLAYLDQMKQMDMEIASEFIAMASHLMLIKTKMLLSAAEQEEAQSEMELLIQSLQERQRQEAFASLKTGITFLEGRNELGLGLFTKGQEAFQRDNTYRYQHRPEDLVRAFDQLEERSQRQLPPPRTSFAGIVGKEPYPVTKKAAQVLQKLLLRGVSRFRQLLQGSRSRSEIVATFLAVLELCRTRKVDIEDENGEPSIRLVEPPAEGG